MEQVLTNRVVDKLATKQQDMKLRNIVNLAPSVNQQDAVNRSELDKLTQSIEDVAAQFTTLLAAAISGNGIINITDLTLNVPTTTINPPASGRMWVVIARQDATGFRNIAWGSNVKYASTAINSTANTISTFQFANTPSGWIMIGQPTTGMVP